MFAGRAVVRSAERDMAQSAGQGGSMARLADLTRQRTTRIVLAAAHVNHDPARSGQRNLRAWCQAAISRTTGHGICYSAGSRSGCAMLAATCSSARTSTAHRRRSCSPKSSPGSPAGSRTGVNRSRRLGAAARSGQRRSSRSDRQGRGRRNWCAESPDAFRSRASRPPGSSRAGS